MSLNKTTPPTARTSSGLGSTHPQRNRSRDKQENPVRDKDQYWTRIAEERLDNPGQHIKVDIKDL